MLTVFDSYIPKTLFVFQKSLGYRYQRLYYFAKSLHLAGYPVGWIDAQRWKPGKNDYELVVVQQEAIPACRDVLYLQHLPVVVDVSQELDPELMPYIHGALIEHLYQTPLVSQNGQPHVLLESYCDMTSGFPNRDIFGIGLLSGTVTPEDVSFMLPIIDELKNLPGVTLLLPDEFQPYHVGMTFNSQEPSVRAHLAESMSIALAPATNNLSSRTLWPILEYAQGECAVVASPFYKPLVRSATVGAIAESQDEWLEKIMRFVNEPHRRKVAGNALQRSLNTRYNTERGGYYTIAALRSLYKRIIGSFTGAISA